jgi:DtxR family Mn-dependent transcriptional regulator
MTEAKSKSIRTRWKTRSTHRAGSTTRAAREARAQGLSRSRQDYLKALLQLAEQAPVPVTALARHLGVSAPSVTNMLARLEGETLVSLHHRGAARLTTEGEREALRIVRRHRILETFLVRALGLDWSEVHEDADVLEHHVSDRVLDALDRFMQHPTEDPHGHPIPDARGRVPRRSLAPIGGLPAGTRAIVREIRDRDRARMTRWKQAGLVPGAELLVRAANREDDVFEIEIGGRRLVTGSEGLDGVLVQRIGRKSA